MVHAGFAETRGVDVDPDQIAACRGRLGDLPGVSFALTARSRRRRTPARGPSSRAWRCWSTASKRSAGESSSELGRLCARRRAASSSACRSRPGRASSASSSSAPSPACADWATTRIASAIRRWRWSAATAGLAVPRVVYEGQAPPGPFPITVTRASTGATCSVKSPNALTIERRTFSPLPWAGSVLNSQVWFICRPRQLSAVDALAAALRAEPLPAGFALSDHLVDEAESQGVAALLARTPAAASAPPAVAFRLRANPRGLRSAARRARRRAGEPPDAFASGGVSPVVIKGAHLAHTIYASPILRPRQDTDLVIAWEEQATMAALLETAGYYRKVHVRGTLILGQCHFVRTDRSGIVHALDVHWRLAAPLVFRRVLPAAALRASRVPIPALGPARLGPRPRPRAAHRVRPPRRAPSRQPRAAVAARHRAARRGPGGSGRGDVLEGAAGAGIRSDLRVGARSRAALFRRTGARRARGQGPCPVRSRRRASARVLRASRPIDGLWLDLHSCEGWRERFTLLREHVCPDPEYMRATTAPAGWLPLAYARRAIAGFGKWVS